MLYIDPATCIDCGSRVDACPVGAIFSEDDLVQSLRRYAGIGRAGWHSIDRAERTRGASTGRSRVKITDPDALVAAARPPQEATHAGTAS